MSDPYRILHISDLHRSPRDPISNDELVSALISDRDRYFHEDPSIGSPDAIIVSGDIIQGVELGAVDPDRCLVEQYGVAEAFLDELVRRLLGGDRSRLVIVPGNHDVDWNSAFAALERVDDANAPDDLAAQIYAEESPYRWDWKTRSLYRIADRSRYEQRLAAFWTFFERFYHGVPGLLKVQRGSDANLFTLCDNRIGVAAFNSCHGNDCFAFHGMIRREAIARSHLELKDSGHIFDLLVGVWHHSIEGGPYRTDYMDIDIVRGMIGRGFRLGLYGHQHKAQAVGHQVWLANQEKMAVVSAGSLCAGARDLPRGINRQYNILEVAPDFGSVRVHVREMRVANLFAPALLPEFGGKSYLDLDWTPLKNAAGAIVNTREARIRRAIEEAERADKEGNPKKAVALLRDLPTPPGSYQRDLLVRAAEESQDWAVVVEATDPPSSITELVQRVHALHQLKQIAEAMRALDRFSRSVSLPSHIELELRQRLTAGRVLNQ